MRFDLMIWLQKQNYRITNSAHGSVAENPRNFIGIVQKADGNTYLIPSCGLYPQYELIVTCEEDALKLFELIPDLKP